MMPLKDKTEAQEKSKEKISGALSTEEIVSLLSKSNKDFIKESDIASNITNLFKKITPSSLAKKNQEIAPGKEEQITNDLNEISEKNNKEPENDVIEEEKPENKKIYTEIEAKKLANDLAKQYYNNGYKLGVKKTTEELQKGEKSLAVTLKNTTDNIFKITPEFIKELNKSISKLLSNLSKEVLGYEIDNNNKFFQEKVKQLVDSVENSIENIEVFLNDNLGMGASNNIGISRSNTDFVFILNPDTIFKPDTLDNLINDLKQIDDFAIVSPVISNQRFPNYKGIINENNKYQDIISVNVVDGFSMLINKKKFQGNFFDENIFLYLENDDLCKRAIDLGHKIYVFNSSIVDHLAASSTNMNKADIEKLRNWHWMWSKFYYNRKHYGLTKALIRISPNLFSSLFKYLIFLILFNKTEKIKYYNRLAGLICSILGKKSYYRVDN